MNASEFATFRHLAEQVRVIHKENDGGRDLGLGFADARDIIFRKSTDINLYGHSKVAALTESQIAHIERGVAEARHKMKSKEV